MVLDATHYPFHYLAKEVQKLIPHSKLTTIKDGPMYLDRAMPKEFAEAIINFLSANKYIPYHQVAVLINGKTCVFCYNIQL